MQNTTSQIMSVWRSHLPVICKLQGYAVAGGSDIALCADLLVKDRLSAYSSMGLSYGGDVGLPVGCRIGEAQACLVAA